MSLGESLRLSARAGEALVWTSVVPLAHIVHRAVRPAPIPHRLREGYTQAWARGLLRIFGVDLVVRPAPPPPSHEVRLVISNHRSLLDIPIMLHLFGGSVLSRADLGRWPLVGWAAKQGGTLFVERSSRDSRAGAVRTLQREFLAGRSVTVFPEGTTDAGDDVKRFYRGAFGALAGTDAHVLPVGLAHPPGTEFIEDSFVEHAGKIARRARVRVGVAIGAPSRPSGRPEEIAEVMRLEVVRLIGVARAALAIDAQG